MPAWLRRCCSTISAVKARLTEFGPRMLESICKSFTIAVLSRQRRDPDEFKIPGRLTITLDDMGIGDTPWTAYIFRYYLSFLPMDHRLGNARRIIAGSIADLHRGGRG